MSAANKENGLLFDDMALLPSLVIQPIYLVSNEEFEARSVKNIVGGEMLLRVHQKSNGEPFHLGRFFDLVEQEGRLCEVDLFVLSQAFHFIKERESELNPIGSPPLRLNINITPQTLINSEAVLLIHEIMEKNKHLAKNLCFELVESYDLSDIELITATLNSLSQTGAVIAFDDFGAGYINTETLHHAYDANVSYIKFDHLITSAIGKDHEKTSYAKQTMEIACDMGIKTLAEGVEHEHVFNHASLMGFHLAQGRWLSHELSVSEFFALLHENDGNQELLTAD